jgi:hypothetical protein
MAPTITVEEEEEDDVKQDEVHEVREAANNGHDRILSIDEILSSDDVEYKIIDGFGPGEKIRIATLTAGDLMEWTDANEGVAQKTAGLRLIIRSLVDAEGNRIASDKHLTALKKKSSKKVDAIVKEILKLNNIKVPGFEL